VPIFTWRKFLNYLLEIGCEEIPARFMPGLLSDLKSAFESQLLTFRLSYEEVETKGTYRRLSVMVKQLGLHQEDRTVTVKGPEFNISFDAKGNPLPPLIGFMKKNNCTLSDIEYVDEQAKRLVVFKNHIPGKPCEEVLADLVCNVLSGLHLPVSMTWGDKRGPFVRPIHWILSLLDTNPLPVEWLQVHSGNLSYGHRFLSGGPTLEGRAMVISSADHYESLLEKEGRVILDQNRRKTLIEEALKKEGQKDWDLSLLEEVVYLVEYPTPLCGCFKKSYLKLPECVLIECMKKHQKYFPIFEKNTLSPSFLVIADNVTSENRGAVIQGNETVLEARLNDAQFFWDEDQKKSLSEWAVKLQDIVFQKGAGSMADKQNRMSRLMVFIQDSLSFKIEGHQIQDAASICKADLLSQMVYEFGHLQGQMGEIYALNKGISPDIAKAISEQYLPQTQQSTQYPETPLGILMALSDRLDTLVTCFQHDILPTSSQDPFGIRRAVYGIMGICLHHGLRLDISKACDLAYGLWEHPKNQDRLTEFLSQRTRQFLQMQGLEPDITQAVCQHPYLRHAYQFGQALQGLKKSDPDQLKKIVNLYDRIQKISQDTLGTVETSLLSKNEEPYWTNIQSLVSQLENLASEPVFFQNGFPIFFALADLMNDYFDVFLIMDPDPKIKKNRLAILGHVHRSLTAWAYFNKIQF